MKTAELIRNDNVYRAMGGECWFATYEITATDASGKPAIRHIKPKVLKVEVVSTSGSIDGVMVSRVNGDQRYFSAAIECLFDDRDDAMDRAVTICEELDGTGIMGQIAYQYDRPKARKPKAMPNEFRVRKVTSTRANVEMRTADKPRWAYIHGLCGLTHWKAGDCVKRLAKGQDIPGYWRMGNEWEFVEVCDYEM